MGNISYDVTKQMRSAAGTARTTPGVGGTTNVPSQFQYGGANSLNTPSTPPGLNPQQHLSKAAGGQGSGSGQSSGGRPAWLQNSQDRFQRRNQYQHRRENQQANFGGGEARPTDYGQPEPSATVTQPGPMYQSQYFQQRFPEGAPSTPEEYQTQMQNYLNQQYQDVQGQAQGYQAQLRNSYMEWVQNRINQGLL